MEVARGTIQIDLNDRGAAAGMRRVQAEVERGLERLDGQRAEADIGADLSELKRNLKEAEARLKGYRLKQQQEAKKLADFEDRQLRGAVLNRQKANAKAADEAYKQQLRLVQPLRDQRKELDESLRVLKLTNKQNDLNARQTTTELANRKKLADAHAKQLVAVEREEVAVNKLQKRYLQLANQQRKLDVKRTPFRKEERVKLQLDKAGVRAEMAALLAELKVIGREGVDIPVRPDVKGFRLALAKGMDSLRGFGDKLAGIGQTAVRVGPFTTSLKGLGVALAFLGPLLTSVLGSLTSLVGVMGTGLAGATALAGAGMAGFGLAAIGAFTVLKPLVAQFKNATQASSAYAKAVREHGKGSDEAAKKLKVLESVLGHVDKQTVENFKSAGDLAHNWENLTKPSRAAAFSVIGNALKSTSDILPQFASRTNTMFGALKTGLNTWVTGLRGSLSKGGGLDNIFGNFNKAIPDLMSGLGSVATVIGRIAESASKMLLGDAAGGFSAWGKRLEAAVQPGTKLNNQIERLGEHAKSVGRFFMALGRIIGTVLNGSADAGKDLVDTMTNALNRWNDFLRSDDGGDKMSKFFSRSAGDAKALYGAIAPLATAFVGWASNLTPFVTGILTGIGYIGRFIGALTKLVGMTGAIGTLGATIGLMWSIGKIGAFIARLAAATAGMKAFIATARAGAGITAAITAGGAARGAVLGAGAAAGAGEIRAASGAATAATGAFAGLSAASIAATAGVAAVGIAAGILAYKIITSKSSIDRAKESFDSLGEAGKKAGANADVAAMGAADLGSQWAHARINLKDARKALDDTKKGTDQHAIALLNYRDAQRAASDGQRDFTKNIDTYKKGVRDSMKAETEREKIGRRIMELDAKRTQQLRQGKAAQNPATIRHLNEELENERKKYENLGPAAEKAANRQAAAGVNQMRAYRGLSLALGQAEQQLGSLARKAPRVSAKIALKYDAPKDAGNVAAAAQKALGRGVKVKTIMQIIADSKGADQAIRRLEAKKITPKEAVIRARDVASSTIKTITNLIQGVPDRKPKISAQVAGKNLVDNLARSIGAVPLSKHPKISANVAGAGLVSQLSGMINALPLSKTINITTNHIDKSFSSRGKGAGHASGRPAGIGRESALVGEGRSGKGAPEIIADQKTGAARVVDGPQIVNLKKSEAVIPTEPAYRKRGKDIVSRMADRWGLKGFAGGYYAPASLPDAPKPPTKTTAKQARSAKVRKKRKGKAYKSQNKWGSYIGQLKTQQEDWERETSIREGAVKEPDDFIVQTGATPVVTAPDGTKTGGEPIYGLDSGAISTFQGQLAKVKEGYDKLKQITYRLTADIPKARTAYSSEINIRQGNMASFHKAYKRNHNLAKHTKNAGAKKAAEARASKALKNYNREKAAWELLKTDRTTLDADAKEAGFDYREFVQDSDDYKQQITDVSTDADKQVADANPKADTGGGSGSTGNAAEQLTYGAAQALTDQLKGGIMKEFGGNMNASVGGKIAAGLAGTGASSGTGMTANQAGALQGALGGAVSGAAGSMVASVAASSGAGSTMAAVSGERLAGVTGGVAAAGGTTDASKTVNITNNFKTQPADPLTWTKGVEFEAGAAV